MFLSFVEVQWNLRDISQQRISMATRTSPVARQQQDKGRSMITPQRGSIGYQSLRWTPSRDFSPHGNIRSRDFSPHMSPDRVTRNISPGRQKLREQNMEVNVCLAKCLNSTVKPYKSLLANLA